MTVCSKKESTNGALPSSSRTTTPPPLQAIKVFRTLELEDGKHA